MYLWTGRKTWHFVSQEWITTLLQQSKMKILDASIAELEDLDRGIDCSCVTAGDLVYFPPGWIHRVWTHEKSLGIGGYVLLDRAMPEFRHAMAQLEALGMDFVW